MAAPIARQTVKYSKTSYPRRKQNGFKKISIPEKCPRLGI
jgi:hypothetical protein